MSILSRLSFAVLLATLSVPALGQVQPAQTAQPASQATGKPRPGHAAIPHAKPTVPASVKTAQPAPAPATTITH